MENKNVFRDAMVVGFAMFAIYFGAGNLIFPPFIGFETGTNWIAGLVGLVLTGIALPILAVVAVANAGGTFKDLTRPINPWFYQVYNVLVMIGVGMLITIPRTAAVAYETGFSVILPMVDPGLLKPIAIIAFFALTYYFANDKSQVIDKVGKVLTPVLLVILVGIVILAIVNPLGTPVATEIANPFYFAFTQAYQTGDVLTGLLCAVIFVEALRGKGYTEKASNVKMILLACVVAFAGLFVVYGGLEYIGATGNSLFEAGTDHTVLLTGLVQKLAGNGGLYALAVAVALACLTTSVGLTAVVADFLNGISKQKISYKVGVALTCGIGVIQAMGGVAKIIVIAGPIFMGIYPISILLVILGLFSKFIPNDGVWKGSALLVVLVSLYDSFSIIGAIAGFQLPAALTSLYMAIPLAGQGFAWIVPAVVGGIVGGLIYKGKKREEVVEVA